MVVVWGGWMEGSESCAEVEEMAVVDGSVVLFQITMA
jgi:hypothetical protein